MAAIIQEVWESVDDGALQIRFGPPQHLGPRDIVELLRVTRNRFVYTPKSHRTGETVSAEGIGVGGVGSRENAASGSLGRQRFVIRGGGGTIDLDAAMAAGHTIEVREVSLCVDGVEKHMLLLCSEPY
jgi:hypothetical protein